MTDDLLIRARALPRPATPGPWSYRPSGNAPSPVFTVSVQFTDRGAMAEKDAKTIAALPDALELIDELIAEVERLRPLAELWGQLEDSLTGHGLTLPEAVRTLLEVVERER